ncbi:unnamed protein product, partial [marine sediment metagenome]
EFALCETSPAWYFRTQDGHEVGNLRWVESDLSDGSYHNNPHGDGSLYETEDVERIYEEDEMVYCWSIV